MTELSDQFYNQVSESIKLVFDLTSHIDERVKILLEHHNETNQRISRLMDRQEDIATRIGILENRPSVMAGVKKDVDELSKTIHRLEVRMAAIEIHNKGHMNKWQMVVDSVFKVAIFVIGLIIAYKFGLKP